MVKAIILHFAIIFLRFNFNNITNKSFQIRVKKVRNLSLLIQRKINLLIGGRLFAFSLK